MFPFRSIGVAVMLCVESLAYAQQGTSSGHLGLLRRQLEMRKVALVTDSSLHLKSCPQKEMYVLMDKNELKKAGLKLFPVEMEKVFHPAVYDFIERTFLHLSLLQMKSQREVLLRQDQLSLLINGLNYKDCSVDFCSILNVLDLKYPFSLTADSAKYRASWQGVGMKVDLLFPKQYDLLLGYDKYELTQRLITNLSLRHQTDFRGTPVKWKESSLQKIKGNVFYDRGDVFMIPQMKSGTYLMKKGTAWSYLFNAYFPEESALNLFSHAHQMHFSLSFSLAVKGYNSSAAKSIDLADFVSLMLSEGCRPYVGIETVDAKQITGTVVYLNRDLMYEHLLYFQLPLEVFHKKENVRIKAVLHPYIPLNNLENLYADESPSAVIQSAGFSY
ncbi:putative uncharacterized protein [Bacteroides sp. CAG:1076]|nr:putative uncharacterized protein [Bacteroides sp. CAG:1076]